MTSPLHIIICHNFSGFSYADSSRQLAIHLAGAGHEVIFYSHTSPHLLDAMEGITIKRWPEKRPTGWKSFLDLYKTIRRHKTDVLLAHSAAINIAGLAAKLGGVKKRIGYYHSAYEASLIDTKPGLLRQWLHRKRKSILYACYTKMICVSKFAATDLNTWFGYPTAKTSVVYNGLADRNPLAISSVYVPGTPIQFISLGRLDAGKNIPEMVKGFLQFIQQHPYMATLTVAGLGPQEAIVKHLCIGQQAVRYVGHIPYGETDKAIKEAHVLVNSTLAEAFGMTSLEAMMHGKPVLASAVGGVPELVADGKTGWLVPGSSASEWQAAFERVCKDITLHPDRYVQMGAMGRLQYVQHFQHSQQINRLVALLTSAS